MPAKSRRRQPLDLALVHAAILPARSNLPSLSRFGAGGVDIACFRSVKHNGVFPITTVRFSKVCIVTSLANWNTRQSSTGYGGVGILEMAAEGGK
jgi:hypothetical protein